MTKRCRAFQCRNIIDKRELFCAIHVGILRETPRLIKPIEDNLEPISHRQPWKARAAAAAVPVAIAWIARLEGRTKTYQEAVKAAASEPPPPSTGGGGSSPPAPGGAQESIKVDRL